MIGIDLVEINRFKEAKTSFVNKTFSFREIKQAKSGNYYKKLAGKWAVKEAAYKAGIKKEIEVLDIENKPYIFLNNKKHNAQVSLSHEKEYAIAIVFY
jgi:NAD(P)H-hydrate epimerase